MIGHIELFSQKNLEQRLNCIADRKPRFIVFYPMAPTHLWPLLRAVKTRSAQTLTLRPIVVHRGVVTWIRVR